MGCCFSPNNSEEPNRTLNPIDVSRAEIHNITSRSEKKIQKGQIYKDRGNQYYSSGEYNSAIAEYEKAIKENPSNVKFYNNLCVCFRKKQDWKAVFQTSKKALKVDPQNKKSLLMYAMSLAELSKTQKDYKNKIKNVQEADNILMKLQYCSQNSKQARQYIQKTKQLRKYYDNQVKDVHNEEFGSYLNRKLNQTQIPQQLKHFYPSKADLIKQLNQYIKNSINEDIPEHFSDPIGFTIFEKPVISNTGLTYELSNLMDYTKANGYIDPITKQKIDHQSVVQNKNLKLLINAHPKITKWKIQQSIQNPIYITF